MHQDSTMTFLSTFKVGETRFIVTSLLHSARDMRAHNPPKQRRPEHMRGWQFETGLFTAIASGNPSDVRYLLSVKRTI